MCDDHCSHRQYQKSIAVLTAQEAGVDGPKSPKCCVGAKVSTPRVTHHIDWCNEHERYVFFVLGPRWMDGWMDKG